MENISTATEIRIVDYPQLQPVAELGPREYLISLFQKLGWDGETYVDPRKILLNGQHWRDVCQEYVSLPGLSLSFIWMSQGPSVSDDLPYGKVEIQEGAF